MINPASNGKLDVWIVEVTGKYKYPAGGTEREAIGDRGDH
jgi:hypothetical protein